MKRIIIFNKMFVATRRMTVIEDNNIIEDVIATPEAFMGLEGAIDDVLCSFEHEYCGSTTSKGKKLIKEEYTHRILRR